MFRWIKEIWTGSDPVEFESSFGLIESVERLKAATRRWGLFTVSQEVASGIVSEHRVSLQRVIPMVGNSFKLFFVGRFELSGDKVVLRGRFTLHWFVKLFMAVWLGFCGLFAVLGIFAALRSPQATPMPFAGLGMLVAGLGIVRLGGWFSRNDPMWLSTVIRNTLSTQAEMASTGQVTDMSRQPQKGWPPTVILVVSAVLLLGGFMSFVSAVTGIQSYQGHSGGAFVRHYADMRLRYVVAVYGALMLALSLGIYRRRMFAWRMGFVVLIGGGILQTLGLLTSNDLGNARVPAIVFSVFAAVILIIWGRWWYAQRVHFHD